MFGPCFAVSTGYGGYGNQFKNQGRKIGYFKYFLTKRPIMYTFVKYLIGCTYILAEGLGDTSSGPDCAIS